MFEGKLICIVGPDGAGKSTQAALLVEELEEKGFSCQFTWLRFRHILSLPILAIARIFGYSEVEELESGRRIGYHYFWESYLLSIIYPVTLLVDMWLTYYGIVLISLVQSTDIIVFDRFVHDTIVGIMISTKRDDFLETTIGQLFLVLANKASTVILLNSEPAVLRERRDDVKHDKTIVQKVQLYNQIADEHDILEIDASSAIEEIHDTIVNAIL